MPLVMDKDRPDQVARRQHRLGDELARPRIATVAPQARLRIGGERREERSHWITPGDRTAEAANIRQNRLTRSLPQLTGVGRKGAAAGQEIHGWLDRRRASFETAAFAASSG